MSRLTPRFAATRTVCEYTEQHYLAAASTYRVRTADMGAAARTLVDWRNALAPKWSALHFGSLTTNTDNRQHLMTVEVFLGDARPTTVRVEAYSNAVKESSEVRQEMVIERPLGGETGGYVYHAAVSSARPAADFTPRVIPHHDGFSMPLEVGWIVWQK